MIEYFKAFKPQYDQSAHLGPRGKSDTAWTQKLGDFANYSFSSKNPFKIPSSSIVFCFVTYWHSRPLQDTRQPEKEDVTYYLNCIWQFWWLSWTSISRDSTAPAELSLRHLRFEFSRIARTLHDDHCDSPVHKYFLTAFLFFSSFYIFFYYVSSLLARCRKTIGTL